MNLLFFDAPSFLLFSSTPLFTFVGDSQRNGNIRIPRPPYSNPNFQQEVPKPMSLSKQQSLRKSKSDFSHQQGQYWNIEGDEAYEAKDYNKAIECYTKAIELSEGTESSFFRNRGEAYKQLNELNLAYQDAVQAIELDDSNIKAHLLCGQVMALQGKNSDSTTSIKTAIVRLTKALTLCAGQKKQYYESQLSKYIYRAKKLLWYKELEINNNQKRNAINNYKAFLNSQMMDENEYEIQLSQFINSIGDPDKKLSLEIPEHLICKITHDIMENPVLTEAGHCYEREVLEQHFAKNGAIDPCTRKPVSTKYFEAINIKQAIEYFLLHNPWAFEYSTGEDYKDIEF